MKDSKRIYEENDNIERKYNEMCGLYDEISLKLVKAIIKINRIERENKELKRNLEELTKEKMYALRNQFKTYEWMEVRKMKEFFKYYKQLKKLYQKLFESIIHI